MNIRHRKAVITAAALIICILFFLAQAVSGAAEASEIYDKTLRLHVLANSDGETDQALKLKVRDAVLSSLREELALCNTKEEAEALVRGKTDEIKRVADGVIKAEGVPYCATVTLTEEHYPERTYGDITLPAGQYSSVRILLGEASGQNWWCVLFPQVCTDTATPASEKMAQVGFTPNQIRLLTKSERPRYKLKFKLAELFAEIKNESTPR